MSGRFARDGQENVSRRPSAEDAGIRRGQVRRALIASTVGTSIEWYDFFLYGTAAALVFPKLFFPDSSQYAGVLASFAIYAVGFAARPVGAAIFGHWGDRIGRKATLISTLMVMGIADERRVLVVDLEDRPGTLGELARELADANVNVELAYATFEGTRLVIATDDVESARRALG